MMQKLIVSALLLAACAHSGGQQIVLSVRGLDCAECAKEVVDPLRAQAGVHEVRFDRTKSEVTIDADLGVQPQSLLSVVEHAGYQASIGAGQGAYQPMPAYPQAADVQIIGRGGQDVARLEPVPGKATVVDFYAEWCGPCHEVDKHLAGVLSHRNDIAVRKIEIVDWNSPAAKHYLTKASEIPYQIVFDKRGQQVAVISGFDLQKLDAAIETAAR